MGFVVCKTGIRLMPTTEYRARKLLKKGCATIFKYRPFTIRLTKRETGNAQPIEYKCDTGYQNIGISMCSEKHEYVHEERILLKDETERHNDCRKYRKLRRNRKTRYRKPRFDNRKGKITKDGFAPSIRNRRDMHIALFKMYNEVTPITSADFEMGQFDTQVLKAIEEGRPLPEGTDYQHGERYGIATLREAVFTRDVYRCKCCGRTPFKDKTILHMHHVGFWKGDRTNRLTNLMTVCEKCHTSRNHKPGGKLYGLEPKLSNMAPATFMTMVRFDMFKRLKEAAPNVKFHMTYGAKTKLSRKDLNIKKSHANDAYAMGEFHPKHRADTAHYEKRRRNNRILSKFYDAKYVDIRDGSIKKGSQLSCGRTKRSVPRNSELNERIYRGKKVSAGKYVLRTKRLSLRPGDKIFRMDTKGTDFIKGSRSNGNILLCSGKQLSIKKIKLICHCGGWAQIIH